MCFFSLQLYIAESQKWLDTCKADAKSWTETKYLPWCVSCFLKTFKIKKLWFDTIE